MPLVIITTITTHVDIDTLETAHEVDIDADLFPQNVALSIVAGGLKSALKSIKEMQDPQPSKDTK